MRAGNYVRLADFELLKLVLHLRLLDLWRIADIQMWQTVGEQKGGFFARRLPIEADRSMVHNQDDSKKTALGICIEKMLCENQDC